MEHISFFRPVTFPGMDTQFSENLLTLADDLFWFGGDKARVVTKLSNEYIVEIDSETPSCLEIAIKVACFMTVIIPLVAFVAKIILRSMYEFKIDSKRDADDASSPAAVSAPIAVTVGSSDAATSKIKRHRPVGSAADRFALVLGELSPTIASRRVSPPTPVSQAQSVQVHTFTTTAFSATTTTPAPLPVVASLVPTRPAALPAVAVSVVAEDDEAEELYLKVFDAAKIAARTGGSLDALKSLIESSPAGTLTAKLRGQVVENIAGYWYALPVIKYLLNLGHIPEENKNEAIQNAPRKDSPNAIAVIQELLKITKKLSDSAYIVIIKEMLNQEEIKLLDDLIKARPMVGRVHLQGLLAAREKGIDYAVPFILEYTSESDAHYFPMKQLGDYNWLVVQSAKQGRMHLLEQALSSTRFQLLDKVRDEAIAESTDDAIIERLRRATVVDKIDFASLK